MKCHNTPIKPYTHVRIRIRTHTHTHTHKHKHMSGPYSGPGNDPFQGGSFQRLTPPSGGTFGIPPPSGGGGGSLTNNVTGGAPFFARNNRGSNVSIPYARVVPLSGTATALPTSTDSIGDFLNTSTRGTVDVIRETDELKKARLAWIMGRRGAVSESDEFLVQIGNNVPFAHSTVVRSIHWDSGKGVNRSSKLCSTEYLSRLFEVAMRRVCIQLSLRYDSDDMGGKPIPHSNNTRDDKSKKTGMFPNYNGGLLGTVSRPMKMVGDSNSKMHQFNPNLVREPRFYFNVAQGRNYADNGVPPHDAVPQDINASFPLQVPLHRSASMTLTNNITFDVSSRDMNATLASRTPAHDSDAVRSIDNRDAAHNQRPDRNFICGIYPRPISPFLHGRTLLEGMSATLLHSEKGYPRRMPDALGDHVAFAALEQAMTRVGILDWRPDGVVNSKLENGPDPQVRTACFVSTLLLLLLHACLPLCTCTGRRRVRRQGWPALQYSRARAGHLQQLVRYRALSKLGRG